jgi:hypothetical protein
VNAINITLGVSNMVLATLTMLISIPLIKGRVPINKIYGFRIRKAFESEELWYKINAYGGRQLLLWSIPLLMVGITALYIRLEGNDALILTVACSPLILLVPAIISWLYGRTL